MLKIKALLIGILATAVMILPGLAQADQLYILYCDSGIAWRIGIHDHEVQRRQIELDYATDVQNAKDDYNAAVAAATGNPDQSEMLLAASQRLQNDLQAAEDRRVASLDALYPNRWDEISSYPDFFIVGYGGPCHFCCVDWENNSIGWFSFLLPYPGYAGNCLFGWHWGDHHGFGDIRPARAAFRARYEANLRLHPRTPADLAFHNANRVVQTRNRSNLGRTHEDDVQYLSNHHLPPGRTTPPVNIPRANHNTSRGSGSSRSTGRSSGRSSGGRGSRGGGSRGSSGGGGSHGGGGGGGGSHGGGGGKH